MEVPCKNCEDRKIPKTCERTCKKWISYKQKHNKEREKYKIMQSVYSMLGRYC